MMAAAAVSIAYSRENSELAKVLAECEPNFVACSLINPAIAVGAVANIVSSAVSSLRLVGTAENGVQSYTTAGGTVIYINFTPQNVGPHRARLKELISHVEAYCAWGTTWVNSMLQNLPSWFPQISHSTLEAQLFDQFFHTGNLAVYQVNSSVPRVTLDPRDPKFHENILNAAMHGLEVSVNSHAVEKLDEVLLSIVDDIQKMGPSSMHMSMHYWILLQVYRLNWNTGELTCDLRTINFLSTVATHEVTSGKSRHSYTSVDVEFSVSDFLFNEDAWTQMRHDKEHLIEVGQSLMGNYRRYEIFH